MYKPNNMRRWRPRVPPIVVAILTATNLSYAPRAPAADAAYPSRPIRAIVPYAPGGAGDNLGRLMSRELAVRLGQQVVVDNRPGGNGIIGMDIAAHAAADGYTLLVGTVGLASLPGLYRRLPFDPLRDFAPISIAITGTYLLGVNPSVGATSVQELVALAKQSPGRLNFGSAGTGTTIHLAGEQFKTVARVDMVHVPYKSAGLAMTDLIAGNIQVMFAPVLVMLPMAKAGKVRALGVTSGTRSALAPEIPAIAETLAGFEVSGWYGLFAPAATPRAIVTRLNAELKKGLEAAQMKERLKRQGLEAVTLSPARSARFFKDDVARWSRVIRDAGIKPE